jgi:hypothetical protein
MQLKLELFDTIDNYRRGSKLNQKLLQTGEPKGTFKYRDPHPTVASLFYGGWGKGKEHWVEEIPYKMLSNTSDYSRGAYVNQKALQTGLPKGFFKAGDAHPTIKGFFYRCYSESRELWYSKEANEEHRLRSNKLDRERPKTEEQKEKNREHMRKWRRTEKGKTYAKARNQTYFKTEKGKLAMAVVMNKRRAAKKKALEELTEREEGLIKQIYAYRIRLQNKLGIEFHVDHIVPLSKGGLHHPMNLQVVPAVWNVRKNNRNTEKWLPNGL